MAARLAPPSDEAHTNTYKAIIKGFNQLLRDSGDTIFNASCDTIELCTEYDCQMCFVLVGGIKIMVQGRVVHLPISARLFSLKLLLLL